MITVQVKIERSALHGFGDRLRSVLDRRLPVAVGDALHAYVASLQTERLTGQALKVRTGALRRSFSVIVRGDAKNGVVGVVTTTSKYFGVHERGATIRPVRAKFLAVPLQAAMTPAGVSRYPSPLRTSLPAAFPEGVFVHNNVLFGKKDGKAIALFALRKQIVIPPRIGAATLWSSFAATTLQQIIGQSVAAADAEAARAGGG